MRAHPHCWLRILLCIGFCAKVSASQIEDVAANALPSVVKIVTYDITGAKRSQGTGFFITPRKILTNAHVVQKAYSAEVFAEENYYDRITVLHIDEEVDLALIQVEAKNEKPLLLSTSTELKPGQRIMTIGNPLGLEKTLSDGLISAVRTSDSFQMVQITAPISPGSSGGPLLSEDGHVVGVVSATIEEGQNLNFAIGIQTLNQFLTQGETPQPLKVAGSRVLWRLVLRWIASVVVGLIALVFGGGWWVIGIVVMILVLAWSFLAWLFKSVWRLVRRVFNRPRQPTGESVTSVYCWKCGAKNDIVFPEARKDVACSECGSTIRIPDELTGNE